MISFFAKNGNRIYEGGLGDCLHWGLDNCRPNSPVKVLKARAGEDYATVIAEVTSDEEIRFIRGGRRTVLKKLRKGVL